LSEAGEIWMITVLQNSNGIRDSDGDGGGAGDKKRTTYTGETTVQSAFLSQKP